MTDEEPADINSSDEDKDELLRRFDDLKADVRLISPAALICLEIAVLELKKTFSTQRTS